MIILNDSFNTKKKFYRAENNITVVVMKFQWIETTLNSRFPLYWLKFIHFYPNFSSLRKVDDPLFEFFKHLFQILFLAF